MQICRPLVKGDVFWFRGQFFNRRGFVRKAEKLLSLVLSFAVFLSLFSFLPLNSKAAEAPYITLLIEGQSAEIYNGKVSFTNGNSLYDIMSKALTAKNIELKAPDGLYGHQIQEIGGEGGTYPVWWHIYVNDEAAQVGVDSIKPSNGDKIVFYLGDDSKILYPTVTVTPANPIEGKTAVISVTSVYSDYIGGTPVTNTVKFEGAKVYFNGGTYTTDQNGSVSITMPAAGDYTFTVEKKTAGKTQALVNIGKIPFKVYKDGTAPSSTGSSGSSGTGTKSAESNSAPGDTSDIDKIIAAGADFLTQKGVNDWGGALALSAAGRSVPESFLKAAAQEISDGDVLTTHLAGLIIGIKAAGANPRSFNGQDLIAQLLSSKIGTTGLNGYTYTLLALDSGNYDIPASSSYTREGIISSILSYQLPNGAFTLGKNTSADSDMTAIAITALAPYMSESRVKKSVDAAVSYLSKTQQSNGGYLPSYTSKEVSESTAQVIIALSTIGINPKTDKRFIKNGKSAVDALLSFRTSNGAFEHIKGGGADYAATEQSVLALCAYRSLLKSSPRVYDLTGIKSEDATTIRVKNPETGESEPFAAAAAVVSLSLIALLLPRKKSE